MDAEDSGQVPVTEQPAEQPIDPVPVTEELVVEQPIDPVPVESEPVAATESQMVVLSDEQFAQLRDLGVYQVAGIWTLIGIMVIIAFWVGWRSTK